MDPKASSYRQPWYPQPGTPYAQGGADQYQFPPGGFRGGDPGQGLSAQPFLDAKYARAMPLPQGFDSFDIPGIFGPNAPQEMADQQPDGGGKDLNALLRALGMR